MAEPDRSTIVVVSLCVLLLTGAISYVAVSPQFEERATEGVVQSTSTTSGSDDRLHRLHEAGITGENVSVGIVDVTGFDARRSNLGERVVASRTFDSGTPSGARPTSRSNAHGTAVASVVARTAPDSKLYFATVDSPESYERAVEWLTANADVIVAPVSFYGQPGDGTSTVARTATRATERGVVFVAPTGNLARGRWSGEYEAARNETETTGTHQFGDGERNYLRGDGDTVNLWLSWDDAHRDEEFTAELYRTDERGTRLVARSQPYTGDSVPNERLTAHLDTGTHFVVVRGPRNGSTARITLESPTHSFESATPERSITAPATGRVLSVGAYDRRAGRLEPFSSRGPTVDGRLGVDVVAPSRHRVAGRDDPFVGTSAAAAYVGGVAALLLDADPTYEPWEVERRLERTATDVGEAGIDVSTGYGRVDPVRAVDNDTG
ncbi:S8 family serine peptidase [Haloprofundus halobius]|uniref:S8 family serine peptidase n=1 Tax=Haloprofundus halobius TaxID=2876194 RepID=UPI001CCCD4E7|nr:S8 family serine peptidase [Haloprofundus halobius]